MLHVIFAGRMTDTILYDIFADLSRKIKKIYFL